MDRIRDWGVFPMTGDAEEAVVFEGFKSLGPTTGLSPVFPKDRRWNRRIDSMREGGKMETIIAVIADLASSSMTLVRTAKITPNERLGHNAYLPISSFT